MREYEVTIILNPNLDDQARNEIIERVEGWLTPDEGEQNAPAIHHWGQRSLAYPIKDFNDGYYVYFEALMEPQRMHEVEREILYIDDVIRHLVVRRES